MSFDDLMRQAGAIWCDQHKRWECSKQSKRHKGQRCHASAVRGTAVCRHHGGQPTQLLKAKGAAAITAWDAMAGDPNVSSSEVVMRVLQMTWLRVNLLSGLLREQFEAEQAFRASVSPGSPAMAALTAALGGADDVGPGAGLIGHTRSAAPGIGTYVTGEALRGLARMEADERERAVKFAKAAHDMGIAEKHLALAEAFTQELAGLIQRILDGLDLTPQQWQAVAVVVPRELARGSSP